MFDPSTDPLGGALKQRYLDSYWQAKQADPYHNMAAPDMNFGPWYQALDEAAGGRKLKLALSGLNNKAGGVPSSGPYDPTSQTT